MAGAPRISLSVGPWTGSTGVQPVTEHTQLQLVMNLRTGPSLQFTIPGLSAAARQIDGLASDVWVYKSGVPFRRLRILPVDQEWGDSGEDDAAITAVGYQKLVEARFIVSGPPTFTGVDQGEIVWQLISHTQGQAGGGLGITAGSRTTGVPRDRTDYQIGQNIGTLTTALGDVIDGCWWGIDVNGVMTAKLFDAFPVRTDPIVRGANATKMKRTRGKTFANAAGAVGSSEQTTPYWTQTAGIATDLRGRWESWDATHSSVTNQDEVEEIAQGNLADLQYPPSTWSIELDVAQYFEGSSNYAEGDIVPLIIPRSAVDEIGIPPLKVTAQITEVSITADDSGGLSVVLAAQELGVIA